MSVEGVEDLFFFKQKTADEMRISDWSSGVCSSDLALRRAGRFRNTAAGGGGRLGARRPGALAARPDRPYPGPDPVRRPAEAGAGVVESPADRNAARNRADRRRAPLLCGADAGALRPSSVVGAGRAACAVPGHRLVRSET